MPGPKLFMLLLGCKPEGRNIEQHDLFFGIGTSLKDIKDDILHFWKEAHERIHIDAWREIQVVDGYKVEVVERSSEPDRMVKLFFINLGGYKQNDFEEYHYKMLTVSVDKASAIQQAKQTAFYQHTGFTGAASHVDDKYGIDVDDIYQIEDILPGVFKEKFSVRLTKQPHLKEDIIHLGYLKLDKI